MLIDFILIMNMSNNILNISKLSIGLYQGADNDEVDQYLYDVIDHAIKMGINNLIKGYSVVKYRVLCGYCMGIAGGQGMYLGIKKAGIWVKRVFFWVLYRSRGISRERRPPPAFLGLAEGFLEGARGLEALRLLPRARSPSASSR